MKVKRRMKKYFNLVEIVLAMAVLTVGIAGVVALIPVGLNSYRDAMADNDGAQNAEAMLKIMESYFTRSSSSFNVISTLPAKKFNKDDDDEINDSLPKDTSSGWNLESGGFYRVDESVGLYGFASPDLEKADFIAHALVWTEPVNILKWDAGASEWVVDTPSGTGNNVVRLNVELSWPVAKPYKQRETRLFVLEIYNKN